MPLYFYFRKRMLLKESRIEKGLRKMPKTRAKQSTVRRKVSEKKTRSYDASSRKEKSDVVSKKIIDTLIELLIKNKGGDVPFALLSKRSKIPLRTIFRLFKDKEALNQATNDYLSQIISFSMTELSELDFLTFSKNTFS